MSDTSRPFHSETEFKQLIRHLPQRLWISNRQLRFTRETPRLTLQIHHGL